MLWDEIQENVAQMTLSDVVNEYAKAEVEGRAETCGCPKPGSASTGAVVVRAPSSRHPYSVQLA